MGEGESGGEGGIRYGLRILADSLFLSLETVVWIKSEGRRWR